MQDPAKSSAPPRSVIIIGAGAAGIKLADVLLRHDPSMVVTVLEANGYVGGRMRHFQFEGHTVEMGANWISGLETRYKNPVWELAKAIDLDGHLVDRMEERATLVLDSQGNDISKEYMETVDRFQEIHEKGIEECRRRGISSQNDVDIRSVLEDCGWPKAEDLSRIERLVEYNVLEVWIDSALSHKIGRAHV